MTITIGHQDELVWIVQVICFDYSLRRHCRPDRRGHNFFHLKSLY